MSDKPWVLELAEAQLSAYNRRDLDAFCACYHDEVVVLDEAGEATMRGIEAFRDAYGRLFEGHELKAWICERVCLSPHVVEKERWWRRAEDGTVREGEVLVRYTEREGRIAIVEFLR